MADTPPHIPPGKKVVERKTPGGGREWVVRDDPGCWVVTAYYGDPSHPDVVAIRKLRDDWLDLPGIGAIVSMINRLYYRVGKTGFARWWKRGLTKGVRNTFRERVSRVFVAAFLHFSRRHRWADRKGGI